MALITIVDKDNNVIDGKSRNDITHGDIYRVSSLWIKNSKGQVLLAQRSFSKSHSPGKWGPAASGTVEYDETYIHNVIKETKEELGIDLNTQELLQGPLGFNDRVWKYFSQSFIYTCDLDISEFVIQDIEVSAIKWFDKTAIDELIQSNREMFTESFESSWKRIIDFF